MEEKEILLCADEDVLNQINNYVVIHLIGLIDGDVKLHKNYESNHLRTILTNDAGTSILVDCQLLVARSNRKRGIRVIIHNNIVNDEHIEFSYTIFNVVSEEDDDIIELGYLDVDNGLDDELVSNDGVLNKFFVNLLKNGAMEEFIIRNIRNR